MDKQTADSSVKRAMMQVYIKGSFEAAELYQRAFDAVLVYNVKTPDNKAYYHAELNICGNILAICETADFEEKSVSGNTMQFCFHYKKETKK